MKPPFLFAVALLLLQVYYPVCLGAQSEQEAIGKSRLGFGFRALWSTFDLNTFNSFFDGNEFPEFENNGVGFGVVLDIEDRTGPFFVSVSTDVFHKRAGDSQLELDYLALNSTVDFKYNLIRDGETLFHPILGFGLTNVRLRSENVGVVPANFGAALTPGNGSFTLRPGGSGILFFLNLGAGLDYRISKKGKFLGVNAGYRLGLNRPAWEARGNALPESPRIDAGGFYMMLHFSLQ